uniref:Uncharacterized protein n=1 Tax=Timema tahoe TaxID=61484 RepID=A0A7R9NVN1_9NEOP|nr:unnamed protein product [Timema tahoe]
MAAAVVFDLSRLATFQSIEKLVSSPILILVRFSRAKIASVTRTICALDPWLCAPLLIAPFVFQWLTDLRDKVTLYDGSHIPVILLANKCDIHGSSIQHDTIARF